MATQNTNTSAANPTTQNPSPSVPNTTPSSKVKPQPPKYFTRKPKESIKKRVKNYIIDHNAVSLGDIALIVGATHVGKSVFSIDLGHDIAAGRSIYGNVPIPSPQKTLVVPLEYGSEDIEDALSAIATFSGFSRNSLKTIQKNFDVDDSRENWISKTKFYETLKSKIAAGYKVIIIDNINHLWINKSKSDDIKSFINKTSAIIKGKAALFIVAHAGKRFVKHLTNEAHMVKGVSELGDSVRATLNLKPVPNVKGLMQLEFAKSLKTRFSEDSEFPILLSYSDSYKNPYCFEVRYALPECDKNGKELLICPSYEDYDNFGFDYIPPMPSEEIKKLITERMDCFNKPRPEKSIWDSLRRRKTYFHLITHDELGEISCIINEIKNLDKRRTTSEEGKKIIDDLEKELLTVQRSVLIYRLAINGGGSVSENPLWIGEKYIEDLKDKFERLTDCKIVLKKVGGQIYDEIHPITSLLESKSHNAKSPQQISTKAYIRPFVQTPLNWEEWKKTGVFLSNHKNRR